MNSPQTEPAEEASAIPNAHKIGWAEWLAIGLTVLLVIWFYFFVDRFGKTYDRVSAVHWLYSAWNPGTDYEHGKLIPIVIIGMIAYRWTEIRSSLSRGSWWGLISVIIGCLVFVAACRTIQPRIAISGFPFIIWGGILFLWGWRSARLMAFPLFFLWLAIPLPGFQQATTHLQLIATQMAHYGSSLFGVETYTQGTTILPVKGDWKPLSIAHGCSGIRSLMALIMISAAWAYMAKMAMWKRILLFGSALPLAIVGNALRVISIFLIAEYGSAEWAVGTWHDWSGLLLFYPFTLFMLLSLHSLLDGGLPWKASRRRQLKRSIVVVKPTSETDPNS